MKEVMCRVLAGVLLLACVVCIVVGAGCDIAERPPKATTSAGDNDINWIAPIRSFTFQGHKYLAFCGTVNGYHSGVVHDPSCHCKQEK